ncbi:MAG: flagellar basal body-associated FliL family protein [Pseudomonadota bacterium]
MAATDTSPPGESAPKKRGSLSSILIGLGLALLLGAGGFYAAYQGVISVPGLSGGSTEKPEAAETDMSMEALEFLPLEPMVVSLGSPGRGRHLRFRAELETVPGRRGEVQSVMPRIQDTLNGYLRAIPIEELETPSALVRLRAQMLRRIQLVTPKGSVRDLLIIEFVLS